MSHAVIGPNARVTLHFAIHLPSGETVDSNFAGKPATFTVGDGNLLPGFEAVLMGLQAGDRQRFTIPPENAFGQSNPQNLQQIPRSQFAEDVELSEGLVVSFADAAGAELPGVVRAWNEREVTVDFNHPLAGRSLIFEVAIVAVEAAKAGNDAD